MSTNDKKRVCFLLCKRLLSFLTLYREWLFAMELIVLNRDYSNNNEVDDGAIGWLGKINKSYGAKMLYLIWQRQHIG